MGEGVPMKLTKHSVSLPFNTHSQAGVASDRLLHSQLFPDSIRSIIVTIRLFYTFLIY